MKKYKIEYTFFHEGLNKRKEEYTELEGNSMEEALKLLKSITDFEPVKDLRVISIEEDTETNINTTPRSPYNDSKQRSTRNNIITPPEGDKHLKK